MLWRTPHPAYHGSLINDRGDYVAKLCCWGDRNWPILKENLLAGQFQTIYGDKPSTGAVKRRDRGLQCDDASCRHPCLNPVHGPLRRWRTIRRQCVHPTRQAAIDLHPQPTLLFFFSEDKRFVVHLLLRKLLHIDIGVHLKDVHRASRKNICFCLLGRE